MSADQLLERLRQEPPVAGPASLVVYRRLSRVLSAGRLEPGARLPAERELADAAGVSRQTLRKALAMLAVEGVVRSEVNRGWFVPDTAVAERSNQFQGFTEMARERGLRPSSHVLSTAVRSASFDEATALGIAPASEVWVVERVRALDDIPVIVENNVFIRSRVEGLEAVDLATHSLLDALETYCGIRPSRLDYTLQAIGADERVAELLRLPVGGPVLAGSGSIVDAADRPIFLLDIAHRGDSYRFTASMYR